MNEHGIDIDYEKDHLVIWKRHRKFNNFRWYYGEKFTKEKIEKQIAEYNSHENRINDCIQAYLITDPLVREICAYRQEVSPLEDILRDIKEYQESLKAAKEYLESAFEELEDL
jgi:hypothetical protein